MNTQTASTSPATAAARLAAIRATGPAPTMTVAEVTAPVQQSREERYHSSNAVGR